MRYLVRRRRHEDVVPLRGEHLVQLLVGQRSVALLDLTLPSHGVVLLRCHGGTGRTGHTGHRRRDLRRGGRLHPHPAHGRRPHERRGAAHHHRCSSPRRGPSRRGLVPPRPLPLGRGVRPHRRLRPRAPAARCGIAVRPPRCRRLVPSVPPRRCRCAHSPRCGVPEAPGRRVAVHAHAPRGGCGVPPRHLGGGLRHLPRRQLALLRTASPATSPTPPPFVSVAAARRHTGWLRVRSRSSCGFTRPLTSPVPTSSSPENAAS